jgi:pSer/pThr/pTyr-binding forkhead associated (FHA) protein
MMESIMDELAAEPSNAQEPASTEPGTETLEINPSTLPAPFLQLDVEAYLLVLGASPGQERRPLVRAKTSFGRQGTDIVLDDPAISTEHFQIEAFGKEFFLRDLESRNGTYLNGTRARYSQLLPGDQITAGKTSLIFRTSEDLIDRS